MASDRWTEHTHDCREPSSSCTGYLTSAVSELRALQVQEWMSPSVRLLVRAGS